VGGTGNPINYFTWTTSHTNTLGLFPIANCVGAVARWNWYCYCCSGCRSRLRSTRRLPLYLDFDPSPAGVEQEENGLGPRSRSACAIRRNSSLVEAWNEFRRGAGPNTRRTALQHITSPILLFQHGIGLGLELSTTASEYSIYSTERSQPAALTYTARRLLDRPDCRRRKRLHLLQRLVDETPVDSTSLAARKSSIEPRTRFAVIDLLVRVCRPDIISRRSDTPPSTTEQTRKASAVCPRE